MAASDPSLTVSTFAKATPFLHFCIQSLIPPREHRRRRRRLVKEFVLALIAAVISPIQNPELHNP
jgi:hypothetical protein